MAPKPDRDEPKKECPSCGLGVSLDANICEFCGWDFTEEDEWILQIEKLERDLLLEKQRFKPGTVGHKIEATLRNPVQEQAEAARTAARVRESEEPEQQEQPRIVSAAEYLIDRERPEPPAEREIPVVEPQQREPAGPAPEPIREVRDVDTAPKVRKVRSVKPQAAPPAPPPARASAPVKKVKEPTKKPQEPAVAEPPQRKVRTVRKVKG